MKVPREVVSLIKDKEKILISIHINPDGDALGSALALSQALESIGKKTSIYCKDPVPNMYRFLPGHASIKSRLKITPRSDFLLILLDCNSPERAALRGYSFERALVIDHHETENDFGDVQWIDRTAAATGLMVFFLIKALGVAMTKSIATNLYTAISVDTGTFRYSNTYPEVLRASAELVESGAEPNRIADLLYERWGENRFNLLLKVLTTLTIKDGIAMTYITREMFHETGTKAEDTENFSNFPRMIDSVNVSALFRESDTGSFRVSLRSKGGVNVATVAEYFGGGGHKNAAGFRIDADLASAQQTLLRACKKIYKRSSKRYSNSS